MNSKKCLHPKAPKTLQKKVKQPKKRTKVSHLHLSNSSVEDHLNRTASSVEPQNETFTFQPNQCQDNEDSHVEFVATEVSWPDEELTREIEIEIFKSQNSKLSSIKTKKQIKNNLESSRTSEKSADSIKLPNKFKNTRNFQKSLDFELKSSMRKSDEKPIQQTPKKSNSKPSNLPPEKKTLKKSFSESEQEISVPKKSENYETKITSNKTNKKADIHSRPTKKLKTDDRDYAKLFLNFTIDIKLLNSKENVVKVENLLNSGRIKSMAEALYVVKIDGKKDETVMNNVQMTNFYKEALIDFYEANHQRELLREIKNQC